MTFLRSSAFAIAFMISWGSVIADERVERSEVRELVGRAFINSEFELLEGLADQYRDERSRTSAGLLHLTLFYSGIASNGLDYKRGDPPMWREALKRFDAWIEAYPDSPTPHLARATTVLTRGWGFRGGGFISQVPEENLRKFHELANETLVYLSERSELSRKDPHWYLVMAQTYRALGRDKASFWILVEEGLDRYPYYDGIFLAGGAYFSKPWGGTELELERFARLALQKTQATRGFEAYARVYWAGRQLDNKRFAFESDHTNWDDMVKGMDAVLEDYPSQWNIQHFAVFACSKRDLEAARKYLEQVQRPLITDSGLTERYKRTCQSWVRYHGDGQSAN